MEHWNKSNDEIFSNIFSGNIPSLIIKIDITQLPESPLKNPESLQEIATSSVTAISVKDERFIQDEDLTNAIIGSKPQIFEWSSKSAECFRELPIESLPTVSGKRKILIDSEDVNYVLKKIKCRIHRSTHQYTKYLQEIPVASQSNILRDVQIPLDDLEDDVSKIKCETDVNQIPKTVSQNTEFLKDFSVEPKSTPFKYPLVSPEYFKNIVPEYDILEETESSRTSGNPTLELHFQNSQNLQEIYMEPVAGKRRETPDEVNVDSVKKMKWDSLEFENIESIQQMPIRSVSTLLKEKQIHLQDFNNIREIMEFQINVNQTPEPLSQISDYSQRIHVAPEFSLFEKTGSFRENFPDIEKETKRQIGLNETLELPFESIDFLQEIPMDSMTGKNKNQSCDKEGNYVVKKTKCELFDPPHQKTEPLQEVLSKSASDISKKKKRQTLDMDFKNTVKKIKRQCRPELQISATAVQIMNDLISHLLDIFDKELHAMKRVKKIKVLTETELELVMKLSLPKVLSAKAIKYGRSAIQEARKNAE